MGNLLQQYPRICVLGGGESGTGAAVLAQQKGHRVFVSDLRQIPPTYQHMLDNHHIAYEQGGHDENKCLDADLLILSPGITPTTPLLQKARARHIPIIGELEWAYLHKGNSRIVAVTGSNGKSTTASLIYHIARIAGKDVALVGNIGKSFAKQVAHAPKQWYIVEVSSFQLDSIDTFRADIALLLNVSEDHLDRYNYDCSAYIHSKMKITNRQRPQDIFIYNADDQQIQQYLRTHPHIVTAKTYCFTMAHSPLDLYGALLQDWKLSISTDEHELDWEIDPGELTLTGKHNQYNLLAATIATTAMNVHKEDIRKALQSFRTLAHRMEFVAFHHGIEFINDSKATNIHSTWYALESMQKPTVLILGGKDKGNDYSALHELTRNKVRALVCLGKNNDNIMRSFREIVPTYSTHTMEDCVKQCLRVAREGDAVLLSPACASFDLFQNYEQRGNAFKTQVQQQCR